MPPSLPVLSGREVVRVFESLGWQVARQSGSHIVMVKEGEIALCRFPIIGKSQKVRYEASFARRA